MSGVARHWHAHNQLRAVCIGDITVGILAIAPGSIGWLTGDEINEEVIAVATSMMRFYLTKISAILTSSEWAPRSAWNLLAGCPSGALIIARDAATRFEPWSASQGAQVNLSLISATAGLIPGRARMGPGKNASVVTSRRQLCHHLNDKNPA